MMTGTTDRCGAWVFVLTWPPETVGGVNEVVFALAEQVRERGYQPIIVIATWDHAPQSSQVRGIEVVNLRLREWSWGAISTALADAAALLRFARLRQVTVWNAHFPGTDCFVPLWLRRLRLLRARFVLSFHGADVTDMRKASGRLASLWRYVLRKADAVVAVSAALRASILEFYPRAEVEVVHNGVAVAAFAPAALRDQAATILHIGKYEWKKSQDVLLPAFRNLLDSGVRAKLIMVGGVGPALDDTRVLLSQLRLGDAVEMHVGLGRDEVKRLFSLADILVLPSRSEGLPLALLEAAACSVPVIATPVGGVPELVRDGVNGLLIAPESVEELQAAMQKLLGDKEMRDRLRKAMRAEVEANWSWDGAGLQYARLGQCGDGL